MITIMSSMLIGEKVTGVRCGSGMTSFKWMMYSG